MLERRLGKAQPHSRRLAVVAVGRKNSIPKPNRPLIDLMQPTENRLRRGRVFSGARGGLHHVYHWPV